jgi:hypothetical protein
MRALVAGAVVLFALLAAPASVWAGPESTASEESAAGDSWFRTERAFNLGAVVLFTAAFFYLVSRSKQGKTPYIRPILGLEALDDAVGRAAEMGRPISYIPGLADVSDPATAASLSVLSKVAERAARLRCRVHVPNYSPLTMPVARTVVQDAFVAAGRRDDYDPDDVVYLTSRHMTYTMATVGILTRQKVAANFMFGHFYSESLILAETGASIGARQIGGCDAVSQLPFFITTCDYTLIGEELFAAGALVSGNPVSRSTIVAHDWFKAAAILVLVFGFVLMLLDVFGVGGAADWANALKNAVTEAK